MLLFHCKLDAIEPYLAARVNRPTEMLDDFFSPRPDEYREQILADFHRLFFLFFLVPWCLCGISFFKKMVIQL